MEPIKSFQDLATHLKNGPRRKMAVANATDEHSVEAVMRAVNEGIVEAYLTGDEQKVRAITAKFPESPYIHYVNVADPKEATDKAVSMVRNGECDILMKGLVNTDVILRSVLNKETGIHTPGNTLSYIASMTAPAYHKMIFFGDPAVIPDPSKEQRIDMIKYAIKTAQAFGVKQPKIALVHATEVPGPKIRYMNDYVEIKEMAKNGAFGDVILDGPMDVFLALDKERGAIKHIDTPVLGDSDIVIFPDFDAANVFYKTATTFGNAQMAGLLYGADKPVVLTSRSESTDAKFYCICMASILA